MSETLNSRLISDLFDLEKLEAGEHISVLDCGRANSRSLDFLSQYNCHLHVLDIGEKLLALDKRLRDEPELEKVAIKSYLVDACHIFDDESFDVCLVWDFFNFLDQRIVSIFCEILFPHFLPTTRIHCFAVLNKTKKLIQQNYGIVDREFLAVTYAHSSELPYSHSQATLGSAMKGLDIKQSVLRADGRLEMLVTPS